MILWKRTTSKKSNLGGPTKHGYRLTVNVNPPEGGSVTIGPSPGTNGNYDHGQLVVLAALPHIGFFFVGWSGDVTTTNSAVSITMDSDKSVTANFRWR